jgi:HEAT repeat protein
MVPSEQRITAASVLGGLRCRDALDALIETLAEGELYLSNACMWALLKIRSRRGSRRLIEIARGKYPLAARQEAIYTLWWLRELRAEPLFIHLCAGVDTEEEYTRDMATEALGNTSKRLRSQKALAARLFDPSPSVRYAALCVCPYVLPGFLRRALVAKLEDPDRVDDNRIIAKLAAEILGDKCCP